MVPDEPLQFEPVFRSYLWGGNRLKGRLNKAVPDSGRWAESWEVVDHGEDQSVVRCGTWKDWTLRQLIESFPQEILGVKAASQHKGFPLLLKYLDCHSVLRVQVHPDDKYALAMTPPDLGKTEAWYIVDTEPDAKLYAGLKAGVQAEDLMAAIKAGKTDECLHVLTPAAGDCVFIPAGTVHALGSGLIVAEIQQASDTTFRLSDWNRVDSEGNSRPLHVESALEVIDFQRGPIENQKPEPYDHSEIDGTGSVSKLVACDKFTLLRMERGEYRFPSKDMFRIFTVPTGSAVLNCKGIETQLSVGETVFVPAAAPEASLVVDADSIVLSASLPA